MSEQYPGGFITQSPVLPDGTTANGIWNLSQQAEYQAAGTWPPLVSVDAQFNYVTMLLHGDGTNGAQNNTFLDSSANNFTVTRYGNATQGSFSPYGSNWSGYFGSGNYLSVPSNTALQILGGSFTLECWFCLTAAVSSSAGLITKHDGSLGYLLRLSTTGVRFYTTASTNDRAYSFAIGQWYHVAVSSVGTTGTLYINGVAQGATFSTNGTEDTASTTQVGRTSTTSDYLPGYISNARIVKGTAVYTSDFTPPTAPLTAISGTSLLTCQSNRFIDNSSNAFGVSVTGTPSTQRFNPFGTADEYETATIGGGGYFDGTTDYLQIADSAQFNLGTSNYTMECWVYPMSSAAINVFFQYQWDNGGGTRLITMARTTSGAIECYYYDASYSFTTAANVLLLNQWSHVALVRNSNTFQIYVNGVSKTSATNSITYPDSNLPVVIGASYGGAYGFNGYMSDTRVVIGTAIYTTTFTPPSAPLTAVSGTQLLCSMQNGAIYDNAMMNDLETVGNAQISTSVVKYGTGSLYFDGTGDYLTFPFNQSTAFGTGDFTIEMWINLSASGSSDGVLIELRASGATSTGFVFNTRASGGTYVLNFYTDSAANLGSTTLSFNTWNHVAVTRSGTTVRLFSNGVVSATFTKANNFSDVVNPTIAQSLLYSNSNITGYIDDLRITNGYARYTTDFTPPTAAFPNIGPT